MADEIKPNESKASPGSQDTTGASRSEERHEDLINKLKEKDGQFALERERLEKEKMELEKKAKDATFEADLLKQAQTYPNAVEFKDDIRSYVDKGLSVEEASKLVLVNKGKFETRNQEESRKFDSTSFGGSSATVHISDEKDPEKMTQEERRAALQKLEDEGKFRVDKDGTSIVIE